VYGTIQQLPEQLYVLGDLAYGLTTNLLLPHRDNGNLYGTQELFNKAHASTRVDVETAIGLLKVVIHVEMPKAAPKKSICHFQKLEMILK